MSTERRIVAQRAYGTVNMLVNVLGAIAFEAIYTRAYRSDAKRLHSSTSPGFLDHETEIDAIVALESQAQRDDAGITIQAGSYPEGTRRRGEVLAVLQIMPHDSPAGLVAAVVMDS